jgi:hypothetical protein
VRVSLLFAALYLGAVILLHRGFGPVNQVVRLLQEMMPGRKASKSSPVNLPPGSAEAAT